MDPKVLRQFSLFPLARHVTANRAEIVVHNSNGTIELMTRKITCTIVVPDCEHDSETQPLFSAEYKRSNRTRASKVVRCFPHCCPHHQIRSYCGSPMHIIISNTDKEAKYFVYGRFEEHLPGPHTLKIGQTLHNRHPHHPKYPSKDTSIIWFQGELIEDESSNSSRQRFLLNGGGGDDFCHWEYDWKSGTSQRQRLTQHHFRVYVFTTSSNKNNSDWVVVGTATSTPFTFMVYRKHHAELAGVATVTPTHRSAKTAKYTHHESDSDNQLEGEALHQEESDYYDDENEDEKVSDYESEQEQENNSDDHVSPHNESPYLNEQDALRLDDMLWASNHQSSIKATSTLATILLFCAKIDVDLILTPPPIVQGQRRYGEALLSAILPLLQAKVQSEIPEHMLLHFVNHCAPQLLLSVTSSERTDCQHRVKSTGEHKLNETVAICSELVCYMLAPSQSKPRLKFLMEQESLAVHHQRRIQESFLQWLSLVTEQVDGFLRFRGTTPDAIVDEIVSIVLESKSTIQQTSSPRFTTGTKRKIHELLRNTKLIGITAFENHLRNLHGHFRGLTTSTSDSSDKDSSNTRVMNSIWNGRWVCRSVERPQILRQRSQYVSPTATSSPTIPRRSSWPHSPTSCESVRHDVSSANKLRIGLVQVVYLILGTIGFDVALEEKVNGDEDGVYTHVFCVRLLTGILADVRNKTVRFPLDDKFRCTSLGMHSPTFIALLSQTCGLDYGDITLSTAVYYRCRSLAIDPASTEQTTTAIELEFIVVVKDEGHPVSILSRCVLTFQIQNGTSSGARTNRLSSMYNRRRLQLRVRVEETRQQVRPNQRQRLNRENDDDGVSRVYAVPLSPYSSVFNLSDEQVCNLYARMNGDWHSRLAFTATYLNCEPSHERSHNSPSSAR